MNKTITVAALCFAAATSGAVAQNDPLRFDPDNFTRQSLTMPGGKQVAYKAYEGIVYVKNVEDPT